MFKVRNRRRIRFPASVGGVLVHQGVQLRDGEGQRSRLLSDLYQISGVRCKVLDQQQTKGKTWKKY